VTEHKPWGLSEPAGGPQNRAVHETGVPTAHPAQPDAPVAAAMATARLYGVGDIRLAREPRPVPEPGEELVRVTAVGLCGSDLHWYREAGIGDARLEQPLVVGHEFAGVIEGGPRHGQRVAVDPAIPCTRCDLCQAGYLNLCPWIRFAGHGRLDGALREYLAWPGEHLHPVPPSLSDADAAMLEPLGVALHALDLGHLRVAATVAVVGCGPIGLLLCQLSRLAGAARVLAVEPLPHRRAAASDNGADTVVDPADPQQSAGWPAQPGGGPGAVPGADVVFEVAGNDAAVAHALELVRPGGRVVLVGIPDEDRTTFTASVARRKGLTIALVRRMNRVYPRAIELVAQRRIDVTTLVTHRYPLAEVAEAFRVAERREGGKVVVEPTAGNP
jgi:L-iditol 2-dehydrogenase